jgi:hypothetical protein
MAVASLVGMQLDHGFLEHGIHFLRSEHVG